MVAFYPESCILVELCIGRDVNVPQNSLMKLIFFPVKPKNDDNIAHFRVCYWIAILFVYFFFYMTHLVRTDFYADYKNFMIAYIVIERFAQWKID